MAAPWSCAVTPSWGPSKSSWSSNSSSICRRNHHHASPRQQRRFPSHPTPCSGDFRDASVDIAHFFTPVEKVGLAGKFALLCNYLASEFTNTVGGHVGTLPTEPQQMEQQPVLTHPHAR